MNDTIQLRAGNKENMPTLADREPAYVRDEKALYVGTPAGNVKITGPVEERVKDLEETVQTLSEEKLTAYKAASVTELSSDSELASVIETVNGLISALKESGIMTSESR